MVGFSCIGSQSTSLPIISNVDVNLVFIPYWYFVESFVILPFESRNWYWWQTVSILSPLISKRYTSIARQALILHKSTMRMESRCSIRGNCGLGISDANLWENLSETWNGSAVSGGLLSLSVMASAGKCVIMEEEIAKCSSKPEPSMMHLLY